MMARYLGPGLLGLGVTAMIAGFMSGMAGNVSAFATVWTYDVYRPADPEERVGRPHYVSMGRWSSIGGVVHRHYARRTPARFFSNILVYLQVLVMLFIIPLFGVVIHRACCGNGRRRQGGWGFLAGILTSIGEFVYVHVFPGYFDAAHLNPDHVQHIALSPLAQDMAVNMYSAFLSLLVSMGVTVIVSMFTTPKKREELKNLVYGLTKRPEEGPTPWYRHPHFWAGVVLCVLVVVNILFW